MIEKALGGIFKVVTDEAAANPAFARRVEEALGKFAEQYVERRKAEGEVETFHPFILFRQLGAEGFRNRLNEFGATELRLIVEQHHLDPSGVLKARAAKKVLVQHIVDAAEKRSSRDAKLFDY